MSTIQTLLDDYHTQAKNFATSSWQANNFLQWHCCLTLQLVIAQAKVTFHEHLNNSLDKSNEKIKKFMQQLSPMAEQCRKQDAALLQQFTKALSHLRDPLLAEGVRDTVVAIEPRWAERGAQNVKVKVLGHFPDGLQTASLTIGSDQPITTTINSLSCLTFFLNMQSPTGIKGSSLSGRVTLTRTVNGTALNEIYPFEIGLQPSLQPSAGSLTFSYQVNVPTPSERVTPVLQYCFLSSDDHADPRQNSKYYMGAGYTDCEYDFVFEPPAGSSIDTNSVEMILSDDRRGKYEGPDLRERTSSKVVYRAKTHKNWGGSAGKLNFAVKYKYKTPITIQVPENRSTQHTVSWGTTSVTVPTGTVSGWSASLTNTFGQTTLNFSNGNPNQDPDGFEVKMAGNVLTIKTKEQPTMS